MNQSLQLRDSVWQSLYWIIAKIKVLKFCTQSYTVWYFFNIIAAGIEFFQMNEMANIRR